MSAFGGKADIARTYSGVLRCLLLTQSGHRAEVANRPPFARSDHCGLRALFKIAPVNQKAGERSNQRRCGNQLRDQAISCDVIMALTMRRDGFDFVLWTRPCLAGGVEALRKPVVEINFRKCFSDF